MALTTSGREAGESGGHRVGEPERGRGKQSEAEHAAGHLQTYTKPMPSQTLHTREPLPLQTKHLLFPPMAMSKLPQPAPTVTLASVFRVRVLVVCQRDTRAKHADAATFKIELMDGL